MFVVTIRTEYRVVPVGPVLRFACVSDLDEYRELLQDPTCTLAHYFQPVAPTPSVALWFDGWMLPKADVAFLWVLEREMTSASGHDERPATKAWS